MGEFALENDMACNIEKVYSRSKYALSLWSVLNDFFFLAQF